MLGKMLDDILGIIDGKNEDTLISDKAPGLEIWRNLKSFEMLDYLTFSERVHELDQMKKTLPSFDSDGNKIALTKEFVTYRGMIKQSAERFRNSSMKLLPYSVLEEKDDRKEYRQEKGDKRRNNKRQVMAVIEIFWSVPKLLPYASMMTILAIINGIPGEFFSGDYIEFESKEDDKGELNVKLTSDKLDEAYRKTVCKGIRFIIKKWKTSKKYDRSTKYRNKLPFYSYETMKKDFWLMISFMKMQQELANYMEDTGNPDGIDLSYLYEAFLSIWPYSPQLFFNIDSKEKDPKIWKGKLDYFFKEPNIDGLDKDIKNASTLFRSDGYMVHQLGTLTLSGYYCLVDSSNYTPQKVVRGKAGNNWLIPYTPYFAAYYFADDFRLYGMLHYGKYGKEYRKRICEILFQKSEPDRKLSEQILSSRLRVALWGRPLSEKKKLLKKYNIPYRLEDLIEEDVDEDLIEEDVDIEEIPRKKKLDSLIVEREIAQICKDWSFEFTELTKKILEEKENDSGEENIKLQSTINSYIDDPYWKMVLGLYICVISKPPFIYIRMPPLRVSQELFMRHETPKNN